MTLCSISSINGVLLLKAAENHIGSEGRGVYSSRKRRLEIVIVIAKHVQKKNDFDLVEINRSYVGDPHMHGKNLIGAIIEWCLMAITKVESFLK